MEVGAKNRVTVSNDLIRAVQRLTLTEKRLLMLAVSKVDNGASINQSITVTVDEFSQFYSLKKAGVYTALQQAEIKLWSRELIMQDTTPPVMLRWIISRAYIAGEGRVELRFHPDLDGHVINLKERFTQYLLSRAAEFKHLYTWRMFELILQFKNTGNLIMKVDDFKRIMEIPEAYNRDFGLIRSKVINPALKEIKEKDGLDVKFTVKKAGRKVTGLEFTFPVEQQKKITLQQPKKARPSKIDKAYIEQHARPGETYETARIRLESEKRRDKSAA